MRVFITDPIGFIGHEIVKELLAGDFSLSCLIRPRSYPRLADLKGDVEIYHGDFFHLSALANGMKGCEAVIHTGGIIRQNRWTQIPFQKSQVEAINNVCTAAVRNKIHRFLLISSLGVDKGLPVRYLKATREMERIVRDQGFNYTIFRLSLCFGREDRFTNLLSRMIRNPLLPFVPIIGHREFQCQPVSVKNVAQAVGRSLKDPLTFDKIYDLAGPEVFTMNGLIDLIAESMGKKHVPKLFLPVWLAQPLTGLFHHTIFSPVATDPILMWTEGNTSSRWQSTFEQLRISPISLRDYLSRMAYQRAA